jgi:cell division protein FtsI/penicillin-binding protein 2
MKDFVIKMWERINWFIGLFAGPRYTVTVSYDNQWGNGDDQQYVHVRKIIKANFKELKFRTNDKRTVHIKGMQGLRYKIEDE